MILKKKLLLKADAEAARTKALEAEEVSDSLELRIPSAIHDGGTRGTFSLSPIAPLKLVYLVLLHLFL